MKYIIMRIRSKISFIALMRRMTIVELIASTVQKTYYKLVSEGYLPAITDEQFKDD